MVNEMPNLGIIGGGQLGSLLASAARKLNIKTVVITDDKDAPAKNFCDDLIFAQYDDLTKIKEFTKEHVDENSIKENGLFYDFLHSKEPYQSIFKNNPWMIPPDLKKPLDWGGDHYWNTTVARKHEYWKEFDLPKPSKDINQIRKDFLEWGFALIEDAMSKEQTNNFLNRLLDQAEGERLAKVENLTPSGPCIC